MKITVIIPNADWSDTAGVRIRYKRLAPLLGAGGHSLELVPIGEFRAGAGLAGDVYLFCKTHGAHAPVLARTLRARGSRVGVDFFDDYFSQSDDSRLVHMRRWFHSMIPALDFALCATPNMAHRLDRLAPGLPVHVVNDPAAAFERPAVAAALARNAERALATRQLDIGWFGIGDNPYFSVGLSDLHAFGESLAACRRLGYTARLRLLTNARALTPERLEMLARLPLDLQLDEWSEEGERALIGESLFCFLPVNGQAFSTVKSLNRAVTALTGGAQVLSVGFGLYESLDAFIYRSPDTLVGDLESGHLRLREATLGPFAELLAAKGDAKAEAEGLMDFLGRIAPPAPVAWPKKGSPAAVIHGTSPTGEVHKAVQRLRCLSVAAPQCSTKLHYDVTCTPRADGAGVDVTLSERAAGQLRPEPAKRARRVEEDAGRPVYQLHLEAGVVSGAGTFGRSARPPLKIVEIARYGEGIGLTRQVLDYLFGTPEVFLSERMSPYWDRAEAPAGDAPAAVAGAEG